MIAGVIEKRIIKDDIELPSADLTKFDNKEITKIFISKNNKYFINDEVIEVDKINQYLIANKKNELVIIADKSLYMNDINVLLIKLHENDIKNIKLLSSRNGS
jgi:biopolymer transport protein ExbD